MGYATAGLRLCNPGMPGQPASWVYSSTDAHATVVGAGYFTDGAARGMKVGDFIFVLKTGSTEGATIHYVKTVTALDASPYTTLAAAIFA